MSEAVDALDLVAMGPASDRPATLAHDHGNFGDGEPLLSQQQDHQRERADPIVMRRSEEIVKIAQLIDV